TPHRVPGDERRSLWRDQVAPADALRRALGGDRSGESRLPGPRASLRGAWRARGRPGRARPGNRDRARRGWADPPRAARNGRPAGVLDQALDGLPGRHAGQTEEAHPVVFADAIVVGRVLERQGQQSLLLQVRLVDPREAARDDGRAIQETRREGGVLTATAFPVVRVADDDPLDALGLVVASDRGEGLPR